MQAREKEKRREAESETDTSAELPFVATLAEAGGKGVLDRSRVVEFWGELPRIEAGGISSEGSGRGRGSPIIV